MPRYRTIVDRNPVIVPNDAISLDVYLRLSRRLLAEAEKADCDGHCDPERGFECWLRYVNLYKTMSALKAWKDPRSAKIRKEYMDKLTDAFERSEKYKAELQRLDQTDPLPVQQPAQSSPLSSDALPPPDALIAVPSPVSYPALGSSPSRLCPVSTSSELPLRAMPPHPSAPPGISDVSSSLAYLMVPSESAVVLPPLPPAEMAQPKPPSPDATTSSRVPPQLASPHPVVARLPPNPRSPRMDLLIFFHT